MDTFIKYWETQNTQPYSNTPVRLQEFIFEHVVISEESVVAANPVAEPQPAQVADDPIETEVTEAPIQQQLNADDRVWRTVVSDRAYFHEEQDLNKRKKAYVVKGDQVLYFPGGTSEFAMAWYKNGKGEWFSGWILRADIQRD